jgi:myo-inositol-1(or 4)-monophosphatase
MVAIGFAKDPASVKENLPVFNALVGRVRKMRMMGAAALSLCFVAAGRFDAYIESGVHLWDIAAAGFIVECAGGEFWRRPIAGTPRWRMLANNGLLRRKIERIARAARKGL